RVSGTFGHRRPGTSPAPSDSPVRQHSQEYPMDQQDWLELSDRVCVITGAASGIGAAIAEQACKAGARVALLDRDETSAQAMASQLRETGAQAAAFACDTSSADSVAQAAHAVERELGRCT